MAPRVPSTPALCVASIAVMAPWPLLGIALLHPQLDRASEAFMFLGGVTMFPLMILVLFGPPRAKPLPEVPPAPVPQPALQANGLPALPILDRVA